MVSVRIANSLRFTAEGYFFYWMLYDVVARDRNPTATNRLPFEMVSGLALIFHLHPLSVKTHLATSLLDISTYRDRFKYLHSALKISAGNFSSNNHII